MGVRSAAWAAAFSLCLWALGGGDLLADDIYCPAAGGCGSLYIQAVQIGSINNAGTTCGGYVDYTNLSTVLGVVNVYPITVTGPGQQCAAWFDWNQDGDFADPEEQTLLYSVPGTGKPFEGRLLVPAGAVLGPTRMRIRIMGSGTLSPCGTTSDGEVEDYQVVVADCSGLTAPTSAVVDRDNICSNDAGQIALSAVGGYGATLRWFSDSCGGTSIGTGNPLVIASPTATTTYYCRWENLCSNSSCVATTFTVIPAPSAPALLPEPPASAGTTNTIAWNPLAGAGGYYAECATDPGFASVVANSGWTTRTSHEFSGLTAGQSYWYRLKAGSGQWTWAQTTQADFQADDIHDFVDIERVPGSVVLAATSGPTGKRVFVYGAPTSGMNNPMKQAFLDDLTAMGHTVTHSQTFPETPSAYDVIVITGSTVGYPLNAVDSAVLNDYVAGGGGLILFESALKTENARIVDPATECCPVSAFAGWTLRTNTVTADSASPLCLGLGNSSALTGYSFTPTLRTGASVALRWSADNTPLAMTFPYPFGKVVFFNDLWAWYKGPEESWKGDHGYGYDLMRNAVSYCARPPVYVASGSLVSVAIALPAGGMWGRLAFNAVTPAGTSLTTDVLADDGTVLLEGLASGADISGVTINPIKLRANLATTDAGSTPLLQEWSVTYTNPANVCEDGWSEAVSSQQCSQIGADLDHDCDVDLDDRNLFEGCGSGPSLPHDGTDLCRSADFDDDDDVDPIDFAILQRCYSGADNIADASCLD